MGGFPRRQGDRSADTPSEDAVGWEIVRDAAQLEPLAGEWDRLVRQCRHATVFAGYEFNRALWSCFEEDLPLRALVRRSGGDLAGVLPLVRRTVRLHGLPHRECGFFRNQHTLRNALLLRSRDESEWAALLAALRDAGGWDVLLLENVCADAPSLAAIGRGARACALPCDPWESARAHRFAAVEGSWSDYLATRSRSFRWQLKKHARRASELGPVEITRLDERRAMAAALPDVFALERRSWQGAEGTSAMGDRDRAFHERLIERLPDDQLGELWLLRIAGSLAASLRMLRLRSTLFVHTTYYDRARRDASPGTLLFEAMMRSAWERGAFEVDFHGDTPFFRRWSTGAKAHVSTRIYRGAYGAALHRARQALRFLRRRRAAGESAADMP
jgi:CelD/BcsL family acetyltransferase involved in cellulose biosynthesis